jgi:hypothetical protein
MYVHSAEIIAKEADSRLALALSLRREARAPGYDISHETGRAALLGVPHLVLTSGAVS